MVDVSKIRPGDKVTVEMEVVRYAANLRDGHDGLVVKCADWLRRSETHVSRSSIITHTPAPREIKVGDTVTWGVGDVRAEVIALHGDFAWVRTDTHNHVRATVGHGSIRHADEATS